MTRLYLDYSRLMQQQITKIVQDEWAAEDLMQTTLVKLIDKVQDLRTKDRNHLINYIISACKNQARNYMRDKNRHAEHSIDEYLDTPNIECIANQVLLMNKGNLLKAGTAAELISSIESKVAQRLCTEEEAEAYQQQYGLGLLLQQQAGQLLRLVGDQLPAEFEPASGISLEEVYLYYCSSDSII